MAHFSVVEDDGGGLMLFVFSDASRLDVVYAHSGYEYAAGQLRQDIAALSAGGDTAGWDGCETDPQALFDSFTGTDSGWSAIADEDGCVAADRMGAAGQAEFCPGLDAD